jgi:hypothetical protein
MSGSTSSKQPGSCWWFRCIPSSAKGSQRQRRRRLLAQRHHASRAFSNAIDFVVSGRLAAGAVHRKPEYLRGMGRFVSSPVFAMDSERSHGCQSAHASRRASPIRFLSWRQDAADLHCAICDRVLGQGLALGSRCWPIPSPRLFTLSWPQHSSLCRRQPCIFLPCRGSTDLLFRLPLGSSAHLARIR